MLSCWLSTEVGRYWMPAGNTVTIHFWPTISAPLQVGVIVAPDRPPVESVAAVPLIMSTPICGAVPSSAVIDTSATLVRPPVVTSISSVLGSVMPERLPPVAHVTVGPPATLPIGRNAPHQADALFSAESEQARSKRPSRLSAPTVPPPRSSCVKEILEILRPIMSGVGERSAR